MKLRTFAVVFTICTLALFTALAVAVIRVSDFLDMDAQALNQAAESIHTAQSLKSRLLTHNRNAYLYSINRSAESQTKTRAQTTEIAELLRRMRGYGSTPEEDAMLAAVEGALDRYMAMRDRLDESSLAPVEQYTRISDFVDEAVTAIDRLITLNREQMAELMRDVNQQNSFANRSALLLLALGGLVLALSLLAILFLVTFPLAAITQVMGRYGDGDSDARAELRGLQEIRQIAVHFNSMADRLEERRQQQLRIVSQIAHDLRTPLHAISMSLEALVLKSADENKELVHLIDRQVKYLDQLVGDFLEASRIEAGRLSLECRPTDIRPLVKDAVELHQGGSERHTFEVDLPDQPLTCHCDGRRLQQVVNNLLSNAVKYSPRGGLIRVVARRDEDGELIVAVTDEGVGVETEDREKIFMPFYRTSNSKGAYPGLGLGLSSTKRVVEAHGGHMRVESEPGEGSTFYVVLPGQEEGDGERDSEERDPESRQ